MIKNYNDSYRQMLEQQVRLLDKLDGKARSEYYADLFLALIIYKITTQRKDRNLTQKDIAKSMGVTSLYISKIESLEKKPSLTTIIKYCYALGFNSQEIIDLLEDRKHNPSLKKGE